MLQGKNLKAHSQRCLKKIMRNYKTQRFEAYLLNLEHDLNLSEFIRQICTNMDHLNIKFDDISDYLSELGKEEQIRRQFGRQFYVLWLEFFIIKSSDLRERLDSKELVDIPKDKAKQLSFFKALLISHLPSYTNDKQKELLQELSRQPFFKDLVNTQSNSNSVIKSRLSNDNKSNFNFSSIKITQAEDIFRNSIEKIINKIGKLNEGNDHLQEKKIDIMEMFNDILESNNEIQSEILCVNLKQIIRNYLGIQVTINRCKILKQQLSTIRQGFLSFKDFYQFSDLVIQWVENKNSIDLLLSELNKILYRGVTNVWYWPIFNEKSFIVFLINACVEDKEEIQQIVGMLNRYPPSLLSPIFNAHSRTFLVQILIDIHQGSYRTLIVKCLLNLCKVQRINLKKQQLTGDTLQEMFLKQGVNEIQLSEVAQMNMEDMNHFYIYDAKTKMRNAFYISLEHTSELIDKFKNDKFEENQHLSSIGYSLDFSFSDKYSQGVYKSGQFNKLADFTSDVCYQGIINYGNLTILGNFIKKFAWKIIERQNWKIYELGPSEYEKITDQMLNNKNSRVFNLRIPQLDALLEINVQNLVVRTFQGSQSVNSIIKEDFGYLIYLPAHKVDKNQEQLQIAIEQQPIAVDESLIDPKQADKENNKKDNIINFAEKFQFLGVFSKFFDKEDGYQIDENLHVLAMDRITVEYFKQWLEINLYQIIEQNLEMETYTNKKKVMNTFKINKALYFLMGNEFRNLEKKLKKTIVDRWMQKTQQIMIGNMKQTNESFQFLKSLIKYLQLKLLNEKQKKNFVINIDSDQRKYLEDKNDDNVDLLDINNKKAEIRCSNQQKQKLLAQIQSLNEVHQFIYECPEAFNLMKQHDDDGYLSNLQYKYEQIDEDKFKISMKLKHHLQFKVRLKLFYEMLAGIPGEIRQMKIDNQGQYIQFYVQELGKFDIQVSKMGNHILIQYNSHFEKQLKETLQRIQQEKQKWVYESAKRQSNEYIIKNIIPQVLFQVKERMQAILKEKSKKGLNPIIEISIIKKNQYSLKAIQIDKQLEKNFNDITQSFSSSYIQFLKIKKQLFTIQKYFNDYFSRLPKQKMKYYYERQMYTEFKKILRKTLTDIITPITQKNNQKLQKLLLTYIRSEDLSRLFNTNLSDQQNNLITNEIKKVNIFHIFVESQITKFQNVSKVSVQRSMIAKHFITREEQLFAKFNSNKLKPQNISSFFKSLNILGKIFYGQQLPITKHLTQFQNLIKNNNVVIVKVGTGSGKSTVIPPFLVGLGYQKVIVTQPRRLPCRQIFKRITSIFGSGVAGYEIGDESSDKENSLVYMTDGLLKVKSLFDEGEFDKIDVLVIDQIHQRSANIDMLLLFLNQYYSQGNRKLKLILCSATIDKQVSKILEDMNLKIANFQVQTKRFPVTMHKIEEGTILDRILLLCRKLKADEQILVFFPGVRQVRIIVQLLKEKFNRQAFPLYSNQPPSQQSLYLNNGQIFISTSIAETSLTFRKLKYVIDSRISRWVKFNSETELMETEQDYSSNSSIQQRKGRLGRTCPGEYHYFVYHSHDFAHNRQHDRTQLEKVDMTNFIFELLLRKNNNFQRATNLLAKLNQEKLEFDKKIEYSKQILSNLCILTSTGNLIRGVQHLLTFGDLGNPQHNYALNEAKGKHCLINMIYLVSFFMMGMISASEMLSYLKTQYKGSDLKVIHDFLIQVAGKINLPFIKTTQIMQQLKTNCPLIYSKPWSRILFRVFSKASQLLKSCSNFIPSINWDDIVDILLESYRNKIFFNQSLFGGNKSEYQKLKTNVIVNYEGKGNQKMDEYHKTYQLNFQSLVYSKDNLPNIIFAMNCNVNPLNQCILSMCEAVDLSKIPEKIKVIIQGIECQDKYLKANDKIKNEKQTFRKFETSLPSSIIVSNKFPSLQLSGPFNKIANSFKVEIQPQRKNNEIRVDMNKMLKEILQIRARRQKNDSLITFIDSQTSKNMFEKLTFKNFKDMFLTTKFEMQNNYDVTIQWEIAAIDRFLVIKNAKNMHVEKILNKLYNFFRWFSDSQMICSEDFKIPPRFIEQNPIISKEVRLRILDRVNQIVDSRIEHYIIKGWVNGRGPFTKYPRTARMIAACWVLVNIFSCVIKGGFVRDWVINGEQVLDTKKDLSKLLQTNSRNKYFEVNDDNVTPSDIDAQLSSHILFDQQKFKKQMAKLGIVVFIQEDGWRKHVIFDFGVPTGGFTADLIQPYTSICHDSYDFDVNTMYIKKDHLNAIGLKIPLEYIDNFHHKTTKVSLEELISLCRNKQMKKLKDNIPKYRFDKFKARGWNISAQEIFEPVCYKSLITQSSPVDISLIGKISSTFEQKMVLNGLKVKIVRIQSLKNKSWDEVFESNQHWIICQLQRQQKIKNPNGYYNVRINSNNALLFHGTSFQACKNIKQFAFDSRYFGSYGFYGRGAYFADDPTVSHGYTSSDSEGNRYMFIVKVALGKQEVVNKEESQKLGPGKGYHSIYGTGRPHKEYIIQRWGQAKPIYLITYKC